MAGNQPVSCLVSGGMVGITMEEVLTLPKEMQNVTGFEAEETEDEYEPGYLESHYRKEYLVKPQVAREDEIAAYIVGYMEAKDRPDFQRMMNDIKNGEINRVIVYKLDRISRSRRFLLRSAGQRQRAASSARSLRQARTGKSSPRFRQANTRSLLRAQKGLTCRSRRQSSSQAVGALI